MIHFFDRDEAGYLRWLTANPEGFVLNADRAGVMPQYPMIHRASHKLVSSPQIGNFTTGDYIKMCSADLDALAEAGRQRFGRAPTYCRQCM
jgi:hypothetical protein